MPRKPAQSLTGPANRKVSFLLPKGLVIAVNAAAAARDEWGSHFAARALKRELDRLRNARADRPAQSA